jgi:hypothetical protein
METDLTKIPLSGQNRMESSKVDEQKQVSINIIPPMRMMGTGDPSDHPAA